MADHLKDEKDRHDAELTEFNEELSRRLASVDRGERVSPSKIRFRLKQKSQQRRLRNRRSRDSD
jgi:hypothetical protein